MKANNSIPALLLCLALASFGCDIVDRFTATKIKDIIDNPRDFENKEVTIYGTVTDAASMLIVKYFEVQDDTGRIKVVTVRTLPAKGEKVKVTGRASVLEVGTERWVVLQEKSKPASSEIN